MMIYLDNAATSFKKPWCVFAKLFYESILTSVNAGRGAHRKSMRALEGINATAEALATLFNIDNPSDIAFLPNASYALNLAMLGILKDDDHVIVTSMDHNSVLRPAALWGNFTIVEADASGYVEPEDIENAIKPETNLIVCSHASNVCGAIQPVSQIGKIAKKYGIHFLLDAAQSAGCMDINIKEIGADMLAFSGHKGLLGPLGTGGLYVNPDVSLNPIISGGTGSMSESLIQPAFMPDMLQVGTLNTPAIMALGTAVKCIDSPEETLFREKRLAEKFIEDLSNFDCIKIYGPLKGERNGTVAFNIGNYDPSEVEEYLDREKGIIVRSGYHCSPLAHKTLGSHQSGAVRVSFGYYSTDYERYALLDAINDFIKLHRQ